MKSVQFSLCIYCVVTWWTAGSCSHLAVVSIFTLCKTSLLQMYPGWLGILWKVRTWEGRVLHMVPILMVVYSDSSLLTKMQQTALEAFVKCSEWFWNILFFRSTSIIESRVDDDGNDSCDDVMMVILVDVCITAWIRQRQVFQDGLERLGSSGRRRHATVCTPTLQFCACCLQCQMVLIIFILALFSIII